jgi:hypothetical protein
MELATIFRHYGPRYLERFADRMPHIQIRALQDIANCRSDAFGGHLDRCDQCGYTHFFHHSCYNRSCPKCQGVQTQKWLHKRREEMLPLHYFHVVFTIPKEIHPIIRSHPTELQDVLMRAAAGSLTQLIKDPKYGGYAGGQPGFLAVLHTWTRTMMYHPHVHCLIPAVVISNSKQGLKWQLTGKKFLVPVFALSQIFRAIFVKMARKILPNQTFGQIIWQKRWNVFCKSTLKGGQNVLTYLARYVHRVAITHNRILAHHNGKIIFKYQACKDYKWKKMRIDAMEFIRRFLQHVLPTGLHKIRYYGFWAPSNRHILKALKAALILHSKNKKIP